MGHFMFFVLHLVAVLFGFVFLMFTIPMHLLYAVMRRPRQVVVVQAGDAVGGGSAPEQASGSGRALLYVVGAVVVVWALSRARRHRLKVDMTERC